MSEKKQNGFINRITKAVRFVTTDMWQMSNGDVPTIKWFFITVLKKLYLAIMFFVDKGAMAAASALTYSTLLALVPILAVIFAIARGFGLSIHIEEWFRNALESQPQAAEIIIGFVNSYLVHTKSGVILGIGLVFMLWTVLMLIHNIEQTFNTIWQVKQQRSMIRTVTDYVSMFVLAPMVIVLTSGISIFLATIAKQTEQWLLLGSTIRFLINLLPYVLMSAVFITLYVFMPNTKVKLKFAIVPGILAGVAMQLLQYFYIYGQVLLSGYNAIYGSFAAIPLFMLWVQFSWTICLFGAELTYTNQNVEEFAFMARTDEISHRYKLLLSAMLLNKICKRFAEGKAPYTALQLKLETHIPIRVTNDLLFQLVQVGLLSESSASGKDEEPVFQPATSLENITVGAMIDRIEAAGNWNIPIDLDKEMMSGEWLKILSLRKKYLDSLREIEVKEL